MDIQAEGRHWGTIETTETAQEVLFEVHGARIHTVWRVWGIKEGKEPLLIGIPEPGAEGMVLRRSLSKTFLQRCGYWPALPEQYVAGVQFENPNDLGRKQDSSSDISGIAEETQGELRRLTCRFAPQEEFPLAYAFAVCTVKDGNAELILDKKTGRPVVRERPME